MDKPTAEIAQQSLDIYSHELGPTYAAVMEKFVGETAVNTVHVTDMQVQTQHEKANRSLILNFVDDLKMPIKEFGFYDDKDIFVPTNGVVVTTDPRIARLAQSFMLWVDNEHGDKHRQSPYFIVGRRYVEPERKRQADTQLLLAAPSNAATDERLITLDTWAIEADCAEETMLQRLQQPYKKEELEAMYNPEKEVLEVNGASPHSFTAAIQQGFSYDRIPRGRIRELRGKHQGDIIFAPSVYTDYSECKIRKETVPIGISDEALSQFDTPTYLNRLATAFGKVTNLRQLISRHTVNLPDAVDKYIGIE